MIFLSAILLRMDTAISADTLKQFDRQGFIAGPGESASDFEKRVVYCQNLQSEIEAPPSPELLREAAPITEETFGIAPNWVPCVFSNHNLPPWHGGCAWIFQKDVKTPTGAFLQMRKSFKEKSTFLGIYKREELVAHELGHVGRMMFEEPRFEEVITYQTASSAFQRYFGPIVRASWETILFAAILMLIATADLMSIATESFAIYDQMMWLKLLPVSLVFAALVRLVLTQKTFRRCRQNLSRSTQNVNAVIYRLTDREIEQFAKSTPEAIRDFAKSQTEVRWKQITSYF